MSRPDPRTLDVNFRLLYPGPFQLDVDFRAGPGFTTLFGPSGSGKTSVLSVIAGLRRPDSGTVRLGDQILFDAARGIDEPPERRRVGYVFQDHLLFPHLTVRQNLLFGRKRRSRESARARGIPGLDSVLDILELGPLRDRLPHTLSGGQRQRVAVGRVLLSGPDVLLLDEAAAWLDAALAARTLALLKHWVAEWNIPALHVTHNRNEVETLGGRVLHIESGRVRAEEPHDRPGLDGGQAPTGAERG